MFLTHHGDCHDGGIGNVDCSLHVAAVLCLEEDVEIGHIEALEFVQTWKDVNVISITRSNQVTSLPSQQEWRNGLPFMVTVLSYVTVVFGSDPSFNPGLP